MNTKIDAIFFDWDGTVINSQPLVKLSLIEIMWQNSDLLLPKYQFKKGDMESCQAMADLVEKDYFGVDMKKSIVGVFGENGSDIVENYRRIYKDIAAGVVLPFVDGVVKFIEKARSKNIPCAVISNKSGAILREEVKKSGLNDNFFIVVGYDDVARPKPYTDMIDHALPYCEHEINLQKSWFIGDSNADLDCAISARCLPFFVGHDANLSEINRQRIVSSDIIKINHYRELSALLENYNKTSE